MVFGKECIFLENIFDRCESAEALFERLVRKHAARNGSNSMVDFRIPQGSSFSFVSTEINNDSL